MGWTDAEKQQLRTLWNDEGLDGMAIAAILGKARSGVLGQVYRMRLAGETMAQRATNNFTSSSKQRSQRERRKHANGHKRPKSVTFSKPEPEEFHLELETGSAGTLMDSQHLYRAPGQLDVPFVENTGCKWPGWGPNEKTGTCCGLPRVGKAWCEYHSDIAWSENVPRKRGRFGW